MNTNNQVSDQVVDLFRSQIHQKNQLIKQIQTQDLIHIRATLYNQPGIGKQWLPLIFNEATLRLNIDVAFTKSAQNKFRPLLDSNNYFKLVFHFNRKPSRLRENPNQTRDPDDLAWDVYDDMTQIYYNTQGVNRLRYIGKGKYNNAGKRIPNAVAEYTCATLFEDLETLANGGGIVPSLTLVIGNHADTFEIYDTNRPTKNTHMFWGVTNRDYRS